MIGTAITAEAFDAVAAMLPSGNVLYKRERTAQGGYFVWLDESVVNNLKRLRGPRDEDFSAVIVRLFGEQSDTTHKQGSLVHDQKLVTILLFVCF